MGNCVRKGSSVEWGGEDWGSFDDDEGSLSSGTEVKIKISKKELEKLMKEADVEGLSLHQVVSHLIDMDAGRHRSWRPALHSIPE